MYIQGIKHVINQNTNLIRERHSLIRQEDFNVMHSRGPSEKSRHNKSKKLITTF